MKRYIVTMDTTGKHLCKASRESHESAASRWDAKYLILTDTWGPLAPRGIFGAKLALDLLPVDMPCRVAWLDADTIITEDCDNLFDLVHQGEFGGVLNFQGDTHGGDPGPSHAPTYEAFAGLLGFDVRYRKETYINGGVLLFDLPRHAFIWREARRAFTANNPTPIDPLHEQTALNAVLDAFEPPRFILRKEYNRIGPAAWNGKTGDALIVHLANISDLRGDKAKVLSSINWRIRKPIR